jgi:hypothetical protein
MKKTFLSFCFTLLTVAAFAQFHWGFKGGLNLSTVKSSHMTPNLAAGFHVGWIGELYFTKSFAMTSELALSDKGFNDKLHLTYLMIPVTARYHVTKKIALEGGAGIGYLIDVFTIEEGKFDSQRGIFWGNNIDFQLATGLYYSLSEKFGLTFRYEYGLSNVIRKNGSPYNFIGDDPLINQSSLRDMGFNDKNRNLQLSITYGVK